MQIDVRSNRARRHAATRNASQVSDIRLRRSLRVISNEDIAFKPDSGRSQVTLTTGE